MTKTKAPKVAKTPAITKERTLKIYGTVFLSKGLDGKPLIRGR